jgi:acyl-coenzyme A thioesterase PaaI-like protein
MARRRVTQKKGDMAQELTESDRALVALATQLRRGMHLVAGREPGSEQFLELAEALRSHFDELETAPKRERHPGLWEGPDAILVPGDGEPFADSIHRPVSGSGNPFSVPMTMYRDGDAVVATVTLEAGFEGAPGRSHGGFVSAIFDDLLGSLPMLQSKIAFTASLTVDYVAPSPVFEPVTFRGWTERVEGKKIFVAGEAHHGDTLVSTATALFIDASDLMAGHYGA